jgi:hypothetical protein
VGTRGRLGVDDYRVSVMGRHYDRSISAHASSELIFDLDGKYESFTCQVALNDVPDMSPSADFHVYADDRIVACAMNVSAHESPRSLSANLSGARRLKLVASTQEPSHRFSIWLDPQVSSDPIVSFVGPLGGFEVNLPDKTEPCGLCIVTVVTNDFAPMASDMLGSLFRNGDVRDASVVIIAFDPDESVRNLAKRHNAKLVEARHFGGPGGISLKTAVYLAPRFVQADKYLLIDSDVFVLGSMQPALASLDTVPDGAVLLTRDSGVPHSATLHQALFSEGYPYFSQSGDESILPMSDAERAYGLVVNTGVIFARSQALLALDEQMRALMPAAAVWNSNRPAIGWREQGVFNVALARLGNAIELDERYNLQCQVRTPKLRGHMEHTSAEWNGKPVVVLHFNGRKGKELYESQCKGRFSHVESPRFAEFGGGPLAKLTRLVDRYCSEAGPSAQARMALPHTMQPRAYIQVFKPISSSRFGRVLCVDAKSALTAAAAALIGASSVKILSENVGDACSQMLATAPEIASSVETRYGDVPRLLLEEQTGRVKYDLVVIDLCGNTKRALTNLFMAAGVLAKGGTILIHDMCHPECDASAVVSKARSQGWTVETVSVVPYGPSLLKATPL